MKKFILSIFFISCAFFATAQCNSTLIATSTTVVGTNTTMDSAGAILAKDSILICTGNTLAYNYGGLYKQFYVASGATLLLKNIQQSRVFLEAGATLQIDTTGSGGSFVGIFEVYLDSANSTLIDTNQLFGGVTWTHCPTNTFTYTMFSSGPCNPLSIVDNSLSSMTFRFENPVHDYIRLDDIVLEKIVQADVIDVSGRTIHSFHDLNNSMDVSNLPKGIYLLKLTEKGAANVTKKFIKD